MTKERLSNEEIAATIEDYHANDRVSFLVAHAIREGHLDRIDDLVDYASENNCAPADVVLALIEMTATDVVPFMKDGDATDAVERLTKAFRNALLRTTVVWVIGRKTGQI